MHVLRNPEYKSAVALLSKFNSSFIDAPTPLVSVAIRKKERKKGLEKMNERRTRSDVRKGSAYLWLNIRSIEDSRLAVVKITDKRDDVNLYCTR